MPQAWKIAPGKGAEDWDVFRRNKCIGLGWLVESDYSTFGSKDEVLAALEAENGKGVPGASRGSAEMIWDFVHKVKCGNIVVANDGYNKVVGIGVVDSTYISPNSRKNPIRKDTTTHRHHVRRVQWLITDPVDLPGQQFFVQRSLSLLTCHKLNRIRQSYAAKYPQLRQTLNQLLVGYQAGISGLLPEEVLDAKELVEGSVRKVLVNAYERNPVARQKCIDTYKAVCHICDLDFGAVYGPEAEGFIHVHHLRPLSEVGKQYVVDPVKDLRPVCPNCHAVLHLGGEFKSIEQVRDLIVRQSMGRVKRHT